jgi:ATP-dependent DNA helicase DinG
MGIVSSNKDTLAAPILRLLGPGGPLASSLPGAYEHRPAQIQMARAVLQALTNDSKLVVEAGTGTGKTLAYLVPALLAELKVVISTGTKTLQEQIYKRDLPLLLEALGLDLPVACMKGISNYLCLRRYAEFRRGGDLLVPDPQLSQLARWAEVTDSGDRGELSALPDEGTLWPEVSPTHETRLGPRCPYFEDCFVTRMRREGAAARVVVVNHHLLFADLALRSAYPEAAVLPAHEALILDEAHQLEAVATSFFGSSASPGRFVSLARDSRRAAAQDQDSDAARLADGVEANAAELFHLLARQLGREAGSRGSGHNRPGRFRLHDPPLCGHLEQPYFRLDAALEALAEHLHQRAAGREERANLVQRARRLREGLALFAERPEGGFILWAEQRPRGGGLSLHASPVEVGPLLQQTLLCEPMPMVFTSATLATGDREGQPLAFYRQRLGLTGPELDEQVEELVLPSPFDFAGQALLYTPRDLPLPNSPQFIGGACGRVEQLLELSAGRALVLFTSHRNLEAARALLVGRLDFPLLVQGERPRTLLLEQFREQVSSVLLATASFWEGVDVAGEALSLVIIDKLPFAVPDDPLTAARIERLRSQGRDPFVAYQLPQAALSLKQGFGRLIRHRSDRGVVAVLDRRLVERGYGRTLLSALPPCPQTTDLDQVRAFFASPDPGPRTPGQQRPG